jgi:hypothetical protein
MPISKLLMADNFQLTCKVPLIKTVVIEAKQTSKKESQAPKKGAKRPGKETAKTKDKQPEAQRIESHAGSIVVEINLQRGDTEEELERNY